MATLNRTIENAGNYAGPRVRVLLVDDHPVLRAGVRALLESEPDLSVVGEAGDATALTRLARDTAFDVVLMDVSLPGSGGAELTKELLASMPRVRVLALSAHEDVSFVRILLDAGALGYALKRSACDELVLAIRIVARGGTYLDPSLASKLVGPASRRSSPSGGLPVVSLSEREAEVIRLIAHGHTAKEMAASLGLSPRTLETYKARAMSKLNLRSRADLIRYAMRSGWLQDC